MKAKDIMNRNPVCALPEMNIKDVADMMVECDCGAVPVIGNDETMKPLLGIVTDRDIVCRLVAKGKNPLEASVHECFTQKVISVSPEDSLETCARVMEENQIRRVPVVDDTGAVVGLVTQAHIARNGSATQAGELLQGLSRKTAEPSAAGRR